PHRAALTWTVFKGSFKIDRLPSTADISIRCFKTGYVSVNGQTIPNLILDGREWKKSRSIEITSLLRAGENEVSVTVSNSAGPPALWLVFQCDGVRLGSGTNWQASCLGAAWQGAVIANDPPIVRPGNSLFGSERVGESLRRNWPILLTIILFAGLICAGSRLRWNSKWPRDPALAAMVLATVLL